MKTKFPLDCNIHNPIAQEIDGIILDWIPEGQTLDFPIYYERLTSDSPIVFAYNCRVRFFDQVEVNSYFRAGSILGWNEENHLIYIDGHQNFQLDLTDRSIRVNTVGAIMAQDTVFNSVNGVETNGFIFRAGSILRSDINNPLIYIPPYQIPQQDVKTPEEYCDEIFSNYLDTLDLDLDPLV